MQLMALDLIIQYQTVVRCADYRNTLLCCSSLSLGATVK